MVVDASGLAMPLLTTTPTATSRAELRAASDLTAPDPIDVETGSELCTRRLQRTVTEERRSSASC